MKFYKEIFLLLLALSQLSFAGHSCLVTLEDLEEENPIIYAKKSYSENIDVLVGKKEYETFYANRSFKISLKVQSNGFDRMKESIHPYTDFEGLIKLNSKIYHINLFRLTRKASKKISIPNSTMQLNFRCHDEVFNGHKYKNYRDFLGEFVPLQSSKSCSSIFLKVESEFDESVKFIFSYKNHKSKKYELVFNQPTGAEDEGNKLIYKTSKSNNSISIEKYKKRRLKAKTQFVEKHTFELKNILLMNKKYHKDVLVHISKNRKGRVRKCYYQRF